MKHILMPSLHLLMPYEVEPIWNVAEAIVH